MRSNPITAGRLLTVVCLAVVVAAGFQVFRSSSTQTPDAEAAKQLSNLGVTILLHPKIATAYGLCTSRQPCAAINGGGKSFQKYQVLATGIVDNDKLNDLRAILFNGSNYDAAGASHFAPDYGIRINATDNQAYMDVMLDTKDLAVHIFSYVSPGAAPVETWIYGIVNPDRVASLKKSLNASLIKT